VDRVVNAVLENEEPITLIVNGQGGTGKSRVINVIRRLISAQAPADDILRVVDKTYAKILNRLRVGHITPAECTLLWEKLIAQNKRATKNEICYRYLELEHARKLPLVLLPTTVLCDEINSAMLDRIGNTIYNLDAINILKTMVKKSLMSKIEKAYQKVEADTTRTAGFEKSLRFCVGARVMLKRNKDVDTRLVNNSVGIV